MSARLVITIDTEPDNQWAMPTPGTSPPDLAFANTRGLSRLVDFLRGLGTPATWLTCYSVARDPGSARLLSAARDGGDEVGAHLHAWETPPSAAADSRAHPYIYEYDPAVRLEKLRSVTRAIEDAFGQPPRTYRAGRWGIDPRERENLAGLGYLIDTSVVPGHDFGRSRGLARGGPDFRRLLDGAPPRPYRDGPIWEVPVSVATPGLLGAIGLGALGARLVSGLTHRADIPSRAAARALRAAGLCRMVWLRPRMHPRDDLVRAARWLMDRGAECINIMFHSSEAFEGTSPRSRTAGDVEAFYGDLAAMVAALRSAGEITPCRLSDLADRMDRP
ncbi:MAG TPA: hypothetical protein VFE84_12265 [Patescibacteria group bacterium]|nr:hypothetical protein [Patescibacteria group bacterium]